VPPCAALEDAVEHTDWLTAGFDSTEARFLMLTAITHHRFGSRIWGARAVARLHAELAEIEAALKRELLRPIPFGRPPVIGPARSG
jgi:hypothetical protein